MSVLDEIRKLDEQKAKLLSQAKDEALRKAQQAVKELNELGFDYQLTSSTTKPTRTRSSGVRDSVLAEIKKHPDGISRQMLFDVLGATDTKAQQSISNAVSALKKNNAISAESGVYKAL